MRKILFITDYYDIVEYIDKVPNVLSINDPGLHAVPLEKQGYIANFLELHFYDYKLEDIHYLPDAPQLSHIQAIATWAKSCENFDVAINCGAGLSRSTAAALIILHEWGLSPKLSVEIVFTVRKLATPNRIMLELYGQKELDFIADKKVEATLQKYLN